MKDGWVVMESGTSILQRTKYRPKYTKVWLHLPPASCVAHMGRWTEATRNSRPLGMQYDEGSWDDAVKTLLLEDSARVWIHVANRRMTREEAHAVQQRLDHFMSGWQSHGASLSAQAAVVHGWIVVLAVDERAQHATGCSIDAAVSVLKRIGELQASMADLDLFDRMAVLHHAPSVSAWTRAPLSSFWAKRKAGLLDDLEDVFDTTVSTLGALKTKGVIPLGQSWHAEMW